MTTGKTFSFKCKIYPVGINWCVDVPARITKQLTKESGRVYIKGKINGFNFTTTLMPVKDSLHRLYVNQLMLKGGNTALGKTALFEIEQSEKKKLEDYPVPQLLIRELKKHKLTKVFEAIKGARKTEILKYLGFIKTEQTLKRNIEKIIRQLKENEQQVRIP